MTWEKLFDLYEEVSKIAPPISHESSDNKYGIGSDDVYGHVKVHSNIDNNTAKQDDTASISAIKSYVTSSIKPNLSDINEINKDTNEENTLFVGDQLFTDVWGAKRTGIHNILVKPIDKKEEIQIVLKRYLEKIVLASYNRYIKKQGRQ